MCIAPGNHDFLGGGSVWETVDWPENVHIFQEPRMTALELPELCAVVHGAAFPPQAGACWRDCRPGGRAGAPGSAPWGDRPGGKAVTTRWEKRRSPAGLLPIWRWAISTSGRAAAV